MRMCQRLACICLQASFPAAKQYLYYRDLPRMSGVLADHSAFVDAAHGHVVWRRQLGGRT